MPEFDYITSGEVNDPLLGVVRYSITRTFHAVCPNCGNPDCAEIERGWKPEPELHMLIEACDVEGLKQELEKRGVAYAEEPWP